MSHYHPTAPQWICGRQTYTITTKLLQLLWIPPWSRLFTCDCQEPLKVLRDPCSDWMYHQFLCTAQQKVEPEKIALLHQKSTRGASTAQLWLNSTSVENLLVGWKRHPDAPPSWPLGHPQRFMVWNPTLMQRIHNHMCFLGMKPRSRSAVHHRTHNHQLVEAYPNWANIHFFTVVEQVEHANCRYKTTSLEIKAENCSCTAEGSGPIRFVWRLRSNSKQTRGRISKRLKFFKWQIQPLWLQMRLSSLLLIWMKCSTNHAAQLKKQLWQQILTWDSLTIWIKYQ